MSYAYAFYTEEEARRLRPDFYWSLTASRWRLNKRANTTVFADQVEEGPRRWFAEYTHEDWSYAGVPHASPPFASLEPLLLWARLEGLL